MRTMKVKLTFTEEILGTAPSDQKLYETYVASKAPNAPSIEQEIESLGEAEVLEKSRTVFSKDKDGELILWDYQIRGFFKEAMGALKQVPGKACTACTAHKKIVDLHLFVTPRQIQFEDIYDIGDCQRPLRANTPMGDRTAIAVSDTVATGATLTFTIMYDNIVKSGTKTADTSADDKKTGRKKSVLDLRPCIIECLKYGQFHGLGQWRNSGKGTFVYEILEEGEME